MNGYDLNIQIRPGPEEGAWKFGGVLKPVKEEPLPTPEPDPIPEPDIDQMVGKFVSVNGKDDNSGSQTLPWRTWKKGFDTIKPGEILRIGGGVYHEWVQSTVIGLEFAPIVIMNMPDETPILREAGDGQPGKNGVYLFPWSERLPGMGAAHLKIKGLEIDGALGTGLKVYNGFKCSYEDLNIHGSFRSAIFGYGYKCQWLRNHLHDNGVVRDNRTHGIYHFGSDNLFRENLIDRNMAFGQKVCGQRFESSKFPSEGFCHGNNNILEHNVYAYQKLHSSIVCWNESTSPGPVENAIIKNNIFFNNSHERSIQEPNGVLWACREMGTHEVFNNLYYSSRSDSRDGMIEWLATLHPEGITANRHDNIYDKDPMFVDPGNGDFHLLPGSPIIGKGIGRY